jgi:soluble lytic murein transglycosylase-like protein
MIRTQKIKRFLGTIVVGMIFMFSPPALAEDQADAFASNQITMNNALANLTARIQIAAAGAETTKNAASEFEKGQAIAAGGDKTQALILYHKAEAILNQSKTVGDLTPLERSFAVDLRTILTSFDQSSNAIFEPGSGLAGLQESQQTVVRQFISFYQNSGRAHLLASWRRMAFYRPEIESILREYKLPTELAYLGIVESGFNPMALSQKQARGIWQFTPQTAERFNLLRHGASDDRTHPVKSTIAAAQYLKLLYGQFGDWYLALAAYNAGENRVQQAISRTGVRDFWELSRSHLLPQETRNYVPAVLAAIAISRNPRNYGFQDVHSTTQAQQPVPKLSRSSVDLLHEIELSSTDLHP